MALVDGASNDLTLEIVRGTDNKNNEEKENVAPTIAQTNVSEGEKQKEVPVTEPSSTIAQQSLPIQQLPSPFQQAEQVVLSKPAAINKAATEEQVSVTVKLQKQQKVIVKQEEQETVTETQTSVSLPVAHLLPTQEKSSSESEVTVVIKPSTKTSSKEALDSVKKNPPKATERTVPSVPSQEIAISEAQPNQIPLESNLSISSQEESIQEAVSVSEVSDVQQAPVVSQQISVHQGPVVIETTSQPVINHLLLGKVTQEVILAPSSTQEVSSTVSQVVTAEIKEQQSVQKSTTVTEGKTITSVVTSEKLITETHSPSVQEILSEVQEILTPAEKEKIASSECRPASVEGQSSVIVESSQIKIIKEEVSIKPTAVDQTIVSEIVKQTEISSPQITNKEVPVAVEVNKAVTEATLQSQPLKQDVSQVTLVEVKSSVIQAPVTTQTFTENIQTSLEEPVQVNFTISSSVDQTVNLKPLIQSSTILIGQSQESSQIQEGTVHIQTSLPEKKEALKVNQEKQETIQIKQDPLLPKQETTHQTQEHLYQTQKKQEQVLLQEKQEILPQKQEVLPLKQIILPPKQEIFPQKQEVLPSKHEVLPIKQVVLQQKQEILPQKQEVLPQRQEVLLLKQEPVLEKPELVQKTEIVNQTPKTDKPTQKLPLQQASHSAPPVQRSTSPFQQIPVQQSPIPQQASLTNMGQGESKKETQPLTEPVIVSQEPPRPLPQLENIPPVPAHLLESFEPPIHVQFTLPTSLSCAPLPQVIKPIPEVKPQMTEAPIISEQQKVSLPAHIQDNIPEIPKHLLESDSQPPMHAKTLKEIHEREIQRVAQEKTTSESTAKMLQEFEELKSMRNEMNEPTTFSIRQQNEPPFSPSLVNGHVSDVSRLQQNFYSSSPSHQIQEFVSPDSSTRRWITRDKKDGPRQEERVTDVLQYQKGNVQMSQTTSHYKMTESYQYPQPSQATQPKSVVWPPPPSSPSRNSPYIFQQPDTISTPPIKDYIWQPPTPSSADVPASVGLSSQFSAPTSEWQTSSTTTPTDDPEKILQEPHESVKTLKKKKIYSSSSFFSEPGELYPTMEEQIQSAKKIADSLSANANQKSRGATMFYNRKSKSSTWSHGTGIDDNEKVEEEYSELKTSGEVTSPLKLFLDPRSVKDAQALRNTPDTVYHNIVSPDVCHDLVKDLNSPRGKGASMFAKRRQKSEDWVIDEKNVKAMPPPSPRPPVVPTSFVSAQPTQQSAPDKIISDLMQNPRIKLIKSPWEAALQSPIGSCDAAFEEYGLKPIGTAGSVVDTIREAAEKRELPGPPESWKSTSTSKFNYIPPPITPSAPRPLLKFSGEPSVLASEDIPAFKTRFDTKSSSRPFSPSVDASNYNRAARGWTPVRTYDSQEPSQASGCQSPLPVASSESIRPTFRDYNPKPRRWISPGETQSSLDTTQLESRALSPGRQLSNYNSLPRSFGSSPRTQPGKLPPNIWPRETKEDYSSGFFYSSPESQPQYGGYGEEVGYTDL